MGRRADLCACSNINGKNKNAPGAYYGYACMYRLGAIGIYEPLMEYAGAGASVPLLGFGNLLWKGMREAIDQNGFIGLFMGGFTSCAVGVSGALVLGYLASLIFQPKMRK